MLDLSKETKESLYQHIQVIENERESLVNILFECKHYLEDREDYSVENYENGEYNLYGKLVDITNNYRRV